MTTFLTTPFLGANDTEAVLVGWTLAHGALATKGQIVGSIETSKTVIDLVCEKSGYLYALADAGDRVSTDQQLAILSPQPVSDLAAVLERMRVSDIPTGQVKVTKKAELMMRKLGFSLDDLKRALQGISTIDESAVQDYVRIQKTAGRRRGQADMVRVGIIGGVGGGGALIVAESLMNSQSQRPACIFDQDLSYHGHSVLGVPVVGTVERLQGMLSDGLLDAVVIAFNRDLCERASLFDRLISEGVPFCNVIDSRADIRRGVEIGTGNVILGNCYIGTCTTIGNNNFISANVGLEHGNILGDGNAFGPGVFTSGNVTVGSRVRFATGIHVEPGVSIGDDAVIASGAVLTADVKAGVTVKGLRLSR